MIKNLFARVRPTTDEDASTHTLRKSLAAASCALLAATTAGVLTASPAGAQDLASRGSAAIGSMAYPVPTNAIFVSPDGVDTATGTESAPLHTVTKALTKATSGATIVLRGGTYHEALFVKASLSVTIENYPGEAVWFDGSVPVADWTQQGSTWVHSGWTSQFDSTPGYSAAQASAMNWLRADHPMAAHPDMVFVDGVQLTQVGSAAAVVPGTFYSDYANSQIVMGTDPTGHEVRSSDLQEVLDVRSPNTTVRGIGFRRFATSVPLLGAINLMGDGDRMDNCVVTDIAAEGLHLGGADQALDHLTVANNGLLGMNTNMADRLRLTNSVFQNNNSEYFAVSPVAAGVKIARSDYDVIDNNLFTGNHSNGLWFDTSSFGMTVTNNDFLSNERTGLSFELSANGLIANNTAANNGFDGIRLCDTGTMRVWNNTLVGNTIRNLDISQDSRVMTSTSTGRDSRRPFPDSTLDWTVKNIEVRNNLMIGGGVFHDFYQDAKGQTPAQRSVSIDHNLFSAPAARGYSPFAAQLSGKIVKYTLPAWTTYTGAGGNNVLSSGTTQPAMANDIADTTRTAPLPGDIATATGLPTDAQAWGSTV